MGQNIEVDIATVIFFMTVPRIDDHFDFWSFFFTYEYIIFSDVYI